MEAQPDLRLCVTAWGLPKASSVLLKGQAAVGCLPGLCRAPAVHRGSVKAKGSQTLELVVLMLTTLLFCPAAGTWSVLAAGIPVTPLE